MKNNEMLLINFIYKTFCMSSFEAAASGNECMITVFIGLLKLFKLVI